MSNFWGLFFKIALPSLVCFGWLVLSLTSQDKTHGLIYFNLFLAMASLATVGCYYEIYKIDRLDTSDKVAKLNAKCDEILRSLRGGSGE